MPDVAAPSRPTTTALKQPGRTAKGAGLKCAQCGTRPRWAKDAAYCEECLLGRAAEALGIPVAQPERKAPAPPKPNPAPAAAPAQPKPAPVEPSLAVPKQGTQASCLGCWQIQTIRSKGLCRKCFELNGGGAGPHPLSPGWVPPVKPAAVLAPPKLEPKPAPGVPRQGSHAPCVSCHRQLRIKNRGLCGYCYDHSGGAAAPHPLSAEWVPPLPPLAVVRKGRIAASGWSKAPSPSGPQSDTTEGQAPSSTYQRRPMISWTDEPPPKPTSSLTASGEVAKARRARREAQEKAKADAPPKPRRARQGDIAPCLHCKEVKKIRLRQLCEGCYARPHIRKKYPASAQGLRYVEPPGIDLPGCVLPMPGTAGECLHCSDEYVTIFGLGLCEICYGSPNVRGLYRPAIADKRRRQGPKLDEPTDAIPGSPEKIAVLTRRARKGLALFHPRDAKIPRDGPGRAPPAVLMAMLDDDD